MDKKNIQSTTRVLGIICLLLVVIAQLFKSQNFISQSSIPYFSVLSLIFLSISLYLKAKSGGLSHYNLPIKTVLFFILIVVFGIALIYYFTAKR